MPVRIIGMIGVTPPAHSATLLVIEGAISPSFIVDFAQAHEAADFDMVLVGYTSSSAEGFLVAMHAAARTERLSYLIAHRPGFVAPTLFARKVATFDHLTRGRVALHVITGKTDAEQEGDGDFATQGRALPEGAGVSASDEAHLGFERLLPLKGFEVAVDIGSHVVGMQVFGPSHTHDFLVSRPAEL